MTSKNQLKSHFVVKRRGLGVFDQTHHKDCLVLACTLCTCTSKEHYWS